MTAAYRGTPRSRSLLRKGSKVSAPAVLEQVVSGTAVTHVRTLLVEYQASLGVDLCFQDFARELEELPGAYAPPQGRLYLAWARGEAAGCVALRSIDARTAEMKRLYVRPHYRGQGLGRALATQIVEDARSLHHMRIVLDTLPSMREAQAMYATLGFEPVEPYTANPIVGTRFLGLTL